MEKPKRKTVSFADTNKVEQQHHQSSSDMHSYIIDHEKTPSSTVPKQESQKIPQYPVITTDNMQQTDTKQKQCPRAAPNKFSDIQSKYQKLSHSCM